MDNALSGFHPFHHTRSCESSLFFPFFCRVMYMELTSLEFLAPETPATSPTGSRRITQLARLHVGTLFSLLCFQFCDVPRLIHTLAYSSSFIPYLNSVLSPHIRGCKRHISRHIFRICLLFHFHRQCEFWFWTVYGRKPVR